MYRPSFVVSGNSRRRDTVLINALLAAFAAILLLTSFSLAPVSAHSQGYLTGVVAEEHGDVFGASDEPQSTVEYRVLKTGSDRVVLQGPGAGALEPGMHVKLRGERHGDRFQLASSGGVVYASAGTTTTLTTGNGVGTKKLAVLLVNFGSNPTEPWTRATVSNVLFGGTSSTAAFWSETSNGKLSLGGSVFGYYTIAGDTSTCDYSTWMSLGKTAATAAGVVLSNFTNIMLVFPKQATCGWAGLATVGGVGSWINGAMTTSVTSHELGHNFGVHHANSLNCTNAAGARVSFSASCTSHEYGDPFDVMGNNLRHTSNWHLREMGILSTSDQQTVTSSGTYVLSTVEPVGGVPRLLRVARPSGDFFYLEWRQPYGTFDNFATTAPAVNGVLIREAPDSGTARSQLIDTTPATTSFYDAPLTVGQTFVDPVSGISITTVGADSSSATLSIQVASGSPTPTPTPTPSPTPDTQAPTTPQSFYVSVTKNKAAFGWQRSTDNSGAVSYRVYANDTVVGTTGATSYATNVKAGTYTFSVVAVDASGNTSAHSNSVTVTVRIGH